MKSKPSKEKPGKNLFFRVRKVMPLKAVGGQKLTYQYRKEVDIYILGLSREVHPPNLYNENHIQD